MSVPTGAHVAVVGSGLAGLSAACALVERGFRVSVLESRRRCGGATFSFRRDDMDIDNGQHVLLRCYSEYRALLRRLGSEDGIDIQRRFDMPVLRPGARQARLRRTAGPAPLHLGYGLARYPALSTLDRARVTRAALALRRLDPSDAGLDERSFGDWLAAHDQNAATLEAVWNLITVAALNCTASEASLQLASMVFRTALLDTADAADIGVPRVPLDELHVEPARRYLSARGADMRTNSTVRDIEGADGGFRLRLDDGDLDADAVVVAVPPEQAERMCPAGTGLDAERLRCLGNAPIVNAHVVFERPVMRLPFAAALSSPVQFVFDRSGPAGVTSGQYLSISLSAARSWIDMPTARMREVFLPELARLLPAARQASVRGFFVTRERRATFQQRPGSARLRPAPRTSIPGLVLAGAWTATGWPDTMEGAVRSGNHSASLIESYLSEAQREVAL